MPKYSLPVEFEVSEFQLARAWISCDDRKKLEAFIAAKRAPASPTMSTAIRCFSPRNEFYLGYTKERAEGIGLLQRQGREEEGVSRGAEAGKRAAAAEGRTHPLCRPREGRGASTARGPLVFQSLTPAEYWIAWSSRATTSVE